MFTDDNTTITCDAVDKVKETLVIDILNPVAFDKMLLQPLSFSRPRAQRDRKENLEEDEQKRPITRCV